LKQKKNNISGKVFAKFIVRKEGFISDIQILKGIGYGCDEETVRVISRMPMWKPGKRNGEFVNVMFTIPVNFVMDENKIASNSTIPTSTKGTNFRIRGINGSENLFILDGKEIKKEDMGQLDPKDIDSINVLKDESAVKIYGEKGRNGVIIINRKISFKESKK